MVTHIISMKHKLRKHSIDILNKKNGGTYIGKTTRHTERRYLEHGKGSSTKTKHTDPSQKTTDSQRSLRRSKRKRKPTSRYSSSIDNLQEEHEAKEGKPKIIKSARLKHVKEYQHHINWNNTKILDKDSKSYRLLIHESLAIKRFQPQLNFTVNDAPTLNP
ncbi:unnamed protein product [Didymodactylos carnosus]|uniref:GIY-YIG domain-containing protein n=1 Tax=Didymodactylos carnosus TaxID=1234261 RepID=A0A8S2G1E6_9BILA|nr:unnamed protein product [Didymodactylos carnosus]CAF4407321.1 unnamed protein product [Didymodactylos carnosus]